MSFSRQELSDRSKEFIDTDDAFGSDCGLIEFLLDHCQIEVPEENRFFVSVNGAGIPEDVCRARIENNIDILRDPKLSDDREARAYTGNLDFGHTTAQWESVISLGIYGLKERIRDYAAICGTDEKKRAFYRRIEGVYSAALRFLKRAAYRATDCGKSEMAEGLLHLTKGAPKTLFEAMQTTIVYYVLQHIFEGTGLRTLGRLDTLYYPFFQKEDRATADKMLLDFLREIDRLKAPSNIPFAIGGTDCDGNSLVNGLSFGLLDAYRKAGSKNTKLHILCSANTPKELIENAFEGIRKGNNSIVFMSDEKIVESLVKLGEDRKDAVNYHVVGCYECGGEGELTCSCNARVNLPKALELTLNDGVDMLTGNRIAPQTGKIETFEDLFAEFEKQVRYLCACAMKETDLCEVHSRKLHSAPFLSGTYASALEKGGRFVR